MNDDGMQYPNSPVPSKTGGPAGERNPDRAIGDDDHGLTYGSAAASGHVEIELPALPGSPNPTERLHARDFGAHVVGKIESSMQRNPYLKSGPQQSPAATFRHYVGVAKGANLMDSAAIRRMETLAAEFEKEPDQAEFFTEAIRPYLNSLRSKRRG